MNRIPYQDRVLRSYISMTSVVAEIIALNNVLQEIFESLGIKCCNMLFFHIYALEKSAGGLNGLMA